jgi:hypothetical protein
MPIARASTGDRPPDPRFRAHPTALERRTGLVTPLKILVPIRLHICILQMCSPASGRGTGGDMHAGVQPVGR